MDINGYEGLYTIDRDGTIKNKKGQIMKIGDNMRYNRIGLSKKGKMRKHSYHRLIAEHFIPNPNNYPYVDHINGNTKDNRIENLRWINASGNSRNSVRQKKTNYPRGVFWCSKNTYYSRITCDGKYIHLGSFKTIEEASEAYEAKYKELMSVF